MATIQYIEKRDGTITTFNAEKITNAIHKSLIATKTKDGKVAAALSKKVVAILEKEYRGLIPTVEDIQDIVVRVLNKEYPRVGKEYSKYRKEREQLRSLKKEGNLKLTVNAFEVLKKRYLLRNEDGDIVENPTQLIRRVAKAIASVEKKYGKDADKKEEEFFNAITNLEFMPNSPTLFNAGLRDGQLAACFVLPVPDSLDGIFDAVKNTALIEQTGGGVGFDFSKLRPHGDMVKSSKGVASGPVSFMKVFDMVTEVIKAGGKRRGAMMGILRVDHPEILNFIDAKIKEGKLSNFNISVAITDKFMSAVKENKDYDLINPRDGSVAGKLNAPKVWNHLVQLAWQTGDPGVIFIDEINRYNPTPEVGLISATNPCGEQPLLPYESCNLGSINLSKFVNEGKIEWPRLEKTVRLGVNFLDDVIDANKYPLKQIEQVTLSNRKIGLGVMGWAEMLIKLKVSYDSSKAVAIGEKVMKFISDTARKESERLGKERGSFANFKKSVLSKKYSAMRNATVTTIAPTGTISIIAGCSSGIEPLFAVSYVRHVLEGAKLFETNFLFEETAKARKFYSIKLLEEIAKQGSIKAIPRIPNDVKKLFVTALDISPEWHVKMQAAFQKHTDNAVSKTINFPESAKINDIKKAYELAYKLKCKGITVYRYGSKSQQVLYIGEDKKYVTAAQEYSGGCMTSSCIDG